MKIYRLKNKNRPGRLTRNRQLFIKNRRISVLLLATIMIFLVVGIYFSKVLIDNFMLEKTEVAWGATFSKKYAEELGLDWRKAYLAALDDLGVKAFRIPVYWDDVEQTPGSFDFSIIDWQLKEATGRGSKVIVAVGMKLPRWPECHIPNWAKKLDQQHLQARAEVMLRETVKHLSKSPNFQAWQVENEPFFNFGECPEFDVNFLKREISIVKSVDLRPVIITESGELSDWVRAGSLADELGISTYRDVWNRYLGHLFWPVTPGWYKSRISRMTPLVDRVFVSELQAEPWSPGPIKDWDINEQLEHMNPDKLSQNMEFVRRMGVNEAYLWGIEWWYWMKENGQPEIWNQGKKIFQTK